MNKNISKNQYKENAHIYLLSNINQNSPYKGTPSLAVWKCDRKGTFYKVLMSGTLMRHTEFSSVGNVTEREHFTKY
jgi:hypothetical protein